MGVYNVENGSHVEEWSQEIRFTSLQDRAAALLWVAFTTTRWIRKTILVTRSPSPSFRVHFMDVGIGPAPYPTSLAIGSYIFGQSLTPNGAIDPEVRVKEREKTESWSIFGAVDFDFADAWTAGAELRFSQEAQKAYNFRYKRCAQPVDAAHDPYGPYGRTFFLSTIHRWMTAATTTLICGSLASCIPIPIDDPDNPTQDTNGDGIVHPYEDGACTPGQDYGTARFSTVTGRLSLEVPVRQWLDGLWICSPGRKTRVVCRSSMQTSCIHQGKGTTSEVSFNSWDPEKLIAYEIGIKGFTSDRRIGLDMSRVLQRLVRHRIASAQRASPLSGRPFTQPDALNVNSGDAKVWGWEVSTDVGITDNLTGRFTVGWTDSR